MMMMQSRSETQAVEVDNNEGDDNGSLLKSLIDRNQRGLTFDLDGNNTMQQSALYSKRLLANADGRFDQDMGNQEEAQGRLPNTNSPARGTTTGSESTTTRENNNNTSGSNKETTATTTLPQVVTKKQQQLLQHLRLPVMVDWKVWLCH